MALDESGDDIPAAPLSDSLVTGAAHRERIGPYLLSRVLGEGGMGIVWEAEQQEPVRRRVALKCIRVGLDGGQFQARFESERQALALMSHPNIARAFDAGCTAEGQPYYVMEMVDGPWITRFCDQQRLDVRRRLELFIEVCRGIQHAHQRGVIHRDIKPSNILVQTEAGRPIPKIIDFGVAKAMGAILTDRTLMTHVGQMVGTPEYMSPEQAGPAGFDVDTRTDVYSLGTLLYELLTGHLPFESPGDPDEVRRRIREEEPIRPSQRVTSPGGGLATARTDRAEPAALARTLRGDLDWIVLKALAKDRTQRYGTPDDLAADLARYLASEPVLAGPPSAAYRARKFIRRHRFGVTAAALAVTGVLAFGVTMAVVARRIALERDRAERVSQFLEEVFQVSDPDKARGREITAREILDSGTAKIEQELAGDPEVQARLLQTLGNVYVGLGLYPRAEALLARCLEIRRRLLGKEHADTLRAMASLSHLYEEQGRYKDAERLWEETAGTQRRVLGPDHRETLTSMNRLATVYERQGRYDESAKLYATVLAARRRMLPPDHEDLFQSLDCLAAIMMARGRYEEAEKLFQEEVDGRTRIWGRDYPSTLWAMNNLGNVYILEERWADAEKLHSETFNIRRRVLGDEHPRTLASMSNLADVYQALGRNEEAAALLEPGRAIVGRVMGPEHRNTLLYTNALADAYFRLGRKADAEKLWGEALAAQSRVLGAEHPDTLDTMTAMADLYIDDGRHDQAERLLRRTVEGMRRTLGEGHPSLAPPMHKLATVAMLRGERTDAIDWLRQAVDEDPRERRKILANPRLAALRGDGDFDRLVGAAPQDPGPSASAHR